MIGTQFCRKRYLDVINDIELDGDVVYDKFLVGVFVINDMW